MPQYDNNFLKHLNQIKEDQEKVIRKIDELREEETDPEVIKQLEEIQRNQWGAVLEIEELKKRTHPFKTQALATLSVIRRSKYVGKQPIIRRDGIQL